MKMLYLLRHGIAEDLGGNIMRDADRPLSPLGIERTERALEGLDRVMELYPDVILTSPLLRARETAEICSDKLKGKQPIVQTPLLEPGVPTSEILQWLDHQDWTSMVLVGHVPDLSMLAGLALSSNDILDISFKKASVCCIRFYHHIQPGHGELEWHLQPRILRSLA